MFSRKIYIHHKASTREKHTSNLRRKKHLQQCHTYQSVCISSKSNLTNVLIKKVLVLLAKGKMTLIQTIKTADSDHVFSTTKLLALITEFLVLIVIA